MADETDLDLDAEAGGGGSKLKLIIIMVVVLLVVVGAAVGVTLMLTGNKAPEPAAEAAPAELVVREPVYHKLRPPFVVNFKQGNRTRLLQAEIALMARDKAVIEAVQTHEPMIRNDLLLVLSAQDFDGLLTDEGKILAQEQALTKIQEIIEAQFGVPGVEELYFTSFVMQ